MIESSTPCRHFHFHARQWVALASLGAIFAALAESNVGSTPLGRAFGLSASSRLDFRVVIPAVLFMQVGTATNMADNATIDRVDFKLPSGDVDTGDLTLGNSGSGMAPVSARFVSNNNSASLTARGSAGGLTNGVDSIPWSQIVPSVGGTLQHPDIGDGSAGVAIAVMGSGRILDQSSTWSFSYRNTAALPMGYYGGHVTYTAVLP